MQRLTALRRFGRTPAVGFVWLAAAWWLGSGEAARGADDAGAGAGRDVGLRPVVVEILGGERKKPLRGVLVSVSRHPVDGLGVDDVAHAVTGRDGGAGLSLSPGNYFLRLDVGDEVPYLRIPVGYDGHAATYRARIEVAEAGPDREQRFTFNLARACLLTLRAVDAETGEGVPGVVFVMENEEGEHWARPVVGDNLGVREESPTNPDGSLRGVGTDEYGYLRRWVGPRPGWRYSVWKPPAGYEVVGEPRRPGPGGVVEVEIDTSNGVRRAGHVFRLRKTEG